LKSKTRSFADDPAACLVLRFGRRRSPLAILADGLADVWNRTYSIEVTLVAGAGLIDSADAGGLEPTSLAVDVVLPPLQNLLGNGEGECPGYGRAETDHNGNQSNGLHGCSDVI